MTLHRSVLIKRQLKSSALWQLTLWLLQINLSGSASGGISAIPFSSTLTQWSLPIPV